MHEVDKVVSSGPRDVTGVRREINEGIRVRTVDKCPICGSEGRELYKGGRDRFFGTAGTWGHKECTKRSCGLVWLNPQPLHDELHKIYATYYTHYGDAGRPPGGVYGALLRGYVKRVYAGEVSGGMSIGLGMYLLPWRRAEVDAAYAHIRPQAAGRLLEIGCGSGGTLRRLADVGWSVEGLDFDPQAVAVARAAGLNVRLGGVAEQGYADDMFDVIVAQHVIEHVLDPEAWIKECLRVLRPGGVLRLYTPNVGALGHRIFGQHWYELHPPAHLHLFRAETLARVVGKAGAQLTELRTTGAHGWSLLGSLMLAREEIRSGDDVWSRWWRSGIRREAYRVAEWAIVRAKWDLGEELIATIRRLDKRPVS